MHTEYGSSSGAAKIAQWNLLDPQAWIAFATLTAL